MNPLGFNAALTRLHSYPRFLDRMKRLQPTALTAVIDSDNDIDKILKLRDELPNTKIVGRVVHPMDGSYHLKPQGIGDISHYVASPVNCLNRWGKLGMGGGILSLLNEPGTSNADNVKRLVEWTVECMYLATGLGITLCICNFSVGTPEWDSRFDPMLREISNSRHYLGVHEYLPKPGRILRFNSALERCKALNIQPPKFIITEAGWDRDTNSGEPDAYNGYISRHIAGDTYARQMTDLCENDYRRYIEDTILLADCIFCYGDTGGWSAFDVEEDNGFWSVIDNWHYVPTPSVTTTTPIAIPQPKRGCTDIVERLRAIADEIEKMI